MKKIKLMALGLMVMMIQSVGAVTLPSTSYNPYYMSDGDEYSSTDGSIVVPGGTMVTGNFAALGGDGSYDKCSSGDPSTCGTCCYNNYFEPCFTECIDSPEHKDDYDYCEQSCGSTLVSCTNACTGGGSVPLDGGLSILLALAFGSGAVRAFKRRK